MKWNEISKFKEFGMLNPMNKGFIAYINFIKEEVEKYNLKMNPDFQRGHIWTEEQQVKYIEFILRGGKSGRDFYFNLNKQTDEYVCIDGLQRTTAFIKFVNNEIKVFNQTFNEFGFTTREAGGIPLPEYAVNVYINYLSDRKSVLEWYIDLNEGGTPHTIDEIEKVKRMLKEIK